MAKPQCCYLAKGAKRPSHTTNTINFDRIPFDRCNSIKRFDLCPFDQKNSTSLQPPTIDNNLNWGLHIDRQIAKCTRVLNFLRRTFYTIWDINSTQLQLYQSCVISILLYASPCWCPSIEGLRKLEKFNSRAMKWVFRSNEYVSSLVSLKLLPIFFQVQRIDILLLWKIINKRVIILQDFTYKSNCTRSGTLKLFELKHNHKFQTNDGFFPRSFASEKLNQRNNFASEKL